jgi:cytoskeletal protein RodZ
VDRIVRIGGPARTRQASIPDGLPSSPSNPGIISVPGGVRSTTGFADTVGATSQATVLRKGRLTMPVLVAAGALAVAVLGGGLFLALRSTPSRVALPDTTSATPATPATVPHALPAASPPPIEATAPAPSSPATASASPPVASARPTARPAATATPTPVRTTTRPGATNKPPSSEDLLLDRK